MFIKDKSYKIYKLKVSNEVLSVAENFQDLLLSGREKTKNKRPFLIPAIQGDKVKEII
jgi:hypothetical protein